jgi:mono/diheme cytochrome c family protein
MMILFVDNKRFYREKIKQLVVDYFHCILTSEACNKQLKRRYVMKTFVVLLAAVFVLGITFVSHAQGPNMMGPGSGKKSQRSVSETTGARIFNVNCNRCHPNGGNVILPDFPLRGSPKLSDFKTFLSFIRDPKMPDGSEGVMPTFSDKQISDKQAKTLYEYIVSAGSSGSLGSSYGMSRGMMGHGMMGYGMMGGHGMGPGMMGGGMMMGHSTMGGYGMGPGMMRGYYQSEECQKFLDDTANLRKELYDKRFEYSEAYRNPKTTPEMIVKLEREILELQKKIYIKAPLGCSW